MDFNNVVYSGHAVRRMFEWGFQTGEVLEVLRNGQVIAEYPQDKPFPSYLLLGFTSGGAVHVVAAIDRASDTCYVITAYSPDPAKWNDDFKTRRTP